MPKSIVIVESPAKARTINKFLGEDYVVLSCKGHIVDLPKSKMGVDIEQNFEPQYVAIPNKKKTISELKKAAKDKDRIYLAADPDREGEAISWHLENCLGKNKEVVRVVLHEITKKAVLEAFKHPRSIDMNLVEAQQARRVLDRIVGYSISPLLWKNVGRGLSAGRVQSVTVRMIVEREKEIERFVIKEYWEIEAKLKVASHKSQVTREVSLTAKLDKIDGVKAEIPNKERADEILRDLKDEEFVVRSVDAKPKKKNPQAPFTTSKLQQEAFNKLSFSAHKTMKVAQELYEGIAVGEEGETGLITYMRTDAVRVSADSQKEAASYIRERFGEKYLPKTPNFYKSKKGAQEAHEAIRPTSVMRTPESVRSYLTQEQHRLYTLIWSKFLASRMSPAEYLVTAVEISAGARYIFKAGTTKLIFKGYLAVYSAEEENKKEEFPLLSVSEKLSLPELLPSQHWTKPPPRFSDASLVKTLEEYGIGRPSTYAPIIYTIVLRGYVRRENGYFHPTDLGTAVNSLLAENFRRIMDYEFTSRMEEELDEIEEGKLKRAQVLKLFYEPFNNELEKAKVQMKSLKREVETTDKVCGKCGKPMVIKWGRLGRFLSCSAYPECKNAQSLSLGLKCPNEKCGGELVRRRSKKGKYFYGCTNYPQCTYITNRLPS